MKETVVISRYFAVTISSQGKVVAKETFDALMPAREFAHRTAKNYDKNHLTTYRIEIYYSDGDDCVFETGGYKNGKEFEY